jgi:hypothetical protein
MGSFTKNRLLLLTLLPFALAAADASWGHCESDVTANSTPVEVSTTVYGTCCGGVGLGKHTPEDQEMAKMKKAEKVRARWHQK